MAVELGARRAEPGERRVPESGSSSVGFELSGVTGILLDLNDTIERASAEHDAEMKWEGPLSETEIAEQKMKDLNALDIEAAMKVVAGTARSMGIVVQD